MKRMELMPVAVTDSVEKLNASFDKGDSVNVLTSRRVPVALAPEKASSLSTSTSKPRSPRSIEIADNGREKFATKGVLTF